MQLIVWEAFVWLTNFYRFPQTAPTDDAVKITSESHSPRTLEARPAQQKEKT